MLKLSRVAPHEWEFVFPDAYNDLMDEFHSGCESYEEGNLDQAEKVFKMVLAQMPDHLDAIHHLALVLSERDLYDQARELWEQAVRIGRKAVTQDFEPGKDRLEWGWLENRPFLRCLHGLALARYKEGQIEEALRLFQELLSLNANDNQGVRAMTQEALFELGRLEDALKLAERYPNDVMPETLYGRALALFKLGRQREATAALKEAVKYLPLVRKELLETKHHLPRTARPDRVTCGGADEAYYYWEHWGRFWGKDPEALEWLRGITRRTNKALQGKSH
jgi:tetratricopeptide (TPR) repeat protein